jgi:preprotein translocase subunit SecD
MLSRFSGRGILILGLFLLSLVTLAPTFVPRALPGWWTHVFDPIHLGLDLQGGIHLVLGVDVDKAVASRTEALAEEFEILLRAQDVIFRRISTIPPDRVVVELYDREAGETAVAILKENRLPLDAATENHEGTLVTREFRLNPKEVDEIREYAMGQALETLRNRIDQFGVSEPVLQRQSGNRILIQLPGIKDPDRAIALLGKTARLEFKLEAEGIDLQTARQGILPDGVTLLYERRSDPNTGRMSEIPIVVEKSAVLTGDLLSNARVGLDPQFNEPYVSIEFNDLGARRFDQVTAANVGKRMAIVLDETVYSAPVIRERISSGSAQISGTFTAQEASDLVIALRSGSLPAPVEILENRTVGPSLGQDSIHKGILSVGIGALLVVLSMILVYRRAGLIANLALLLNIVFILAMLSLFQATLTLPGIAGIVLTIGMAVDANVLIYERIREELAMGRTPRAAVGAGYSKALSSITDSNLTTLIAALVLFQFGTGPIKGFAVTLSIGIASSMFTAIIVTRFIFDYLLERRNIRQLSI